MLRVEDAIRECLDRCRGHETPLACLALYMDELRQAGWNETDLRAVERAVVRMLGVIVDPPAIEPVGCPKCKWPSPVVLIRGSAETVYRCTNCQHQWREATA